MANDADTTTPDKVTRDLHATRVYCECGHSAFVHGDAGGQPCLYSICECLRFTDSAAWRHRVTPLPRHR